MKISKKLIERVVRLDNARYHGATRPAAAIMLLLAHATLGGRFAESSVPYMNRDLDDPKGPMKKTSYHYGIERDGKIVRTLDPLTISYGAGDSGWPNPVHWGRGGNKTSLNPVAVNIAFALEKGETASAVQMESGLFLFRTLMERFDVPSHDVLAHKEVSPGRKFDPDTISMPWFRSQLQNVTLV